MFNSTFSMNLERLLKVITKDLEIALNISEFVKLCDSNTINSQNTKGQTALHHAISIGNLKAAIALLNHKEINPNIADREGKTPLHYAVGKNYQNLVSKLIEKGADVNIADRNKITPLHIAATNDSAEIAEILLNNKANLNTQDKDGETPLYMAATFGNFKVGKILLDNGANPNICARSSSEPTALNILLDCFLDIRGKDIPKEIFKEFTLALLKHPKINLTEYSNKPPYELKYLEINLEDILKNKHAETSGNTDIHNFDVFELTGDIIISH